MTLSESQLGALRNLKRKHGGEDVAFINIADARVLTELGFASRSREGWTITEAGIAVLGDEPTPRGGKPREIQGPKEV